MGAHLFLNTPNSLLLWSSTILSALNEWLIFVSCKQDIRVNILGAKDPPQICLCEQMLNAYYKNGHVKGVVNGLL